MSFIKENNFSFNTMKSSEFGSNFSSGKLFNSSYDVLNSLSTPSTLSETQSSSNLKITVCVTAKFDLKLPLDLKKLSGSMAAGRAKLQDSGKTLKIQDKNSKFAVLVSHEGKGKCINASSEEEALVACRRVARLIQKKGLSVKFKDFQISNISYELGLGRLINLDALSKNTVFKKTIVEPELYDGVLIKDDGMVCSIREGGEIFLNGAKSIKQANTFMTKLDDILVEIFSWEQSQSHQEECLAASEEGENCNCGCYGYSTSPSQNEEEHQERE